MGSRNFSCDKGVTQLLVDLESLLHDSHSADLVFYIGPKEIPIRCHSFLLKYRCKAFPEYNNGMKYPEISPELFRTFLMYVYTGKLSVDAPSVFDLLCIGTQFGMADLEKNCEELLFCGGNLNPSSACSLLDAALNAKKKQRNVGKGIQRVIDRCVAFIGENPTDCLQTSRCLAFPMETLVEIISSDQLCLEEEEVWRFVLRWAQFQAGVDTHVSRWSEDEQHRVAKYLSPVISHVRLLLIDSRIFAEEVEPSGCVPMTMLLERYRFAALPNQLGELDPRLNPRNTPRLFQSSTIIQNEGIVLGRKLNEWFGGGSKQSWRCVYRASLHGFSSEEFHNRCDGISPTYVVALIQNTKWICGGFADVPWTRSKTPRYATSNRAFLFSYDGSACAGSLNSRSQPITRFNIVKKHFAICHDSRSGPIFGAGSDLAISSNCNTNSDSYSNLPHSYEAEDGGGVKDYGSCDTALLTPSYNFTVADYEVFTPVDNNTSEDQDQEQEQEVS